MRFIFDLEKSIYMHNLSKLQGIYEYPQPFY